MSFRKLLFALCALAFASPAAAQVSKGTINTEINNSSAAGQPGGVILDNIVASYVDWLTCTGTGGLVYWNSGTPTCLLIGTTGQVLTVSGGAPVWATPSGGSGTPGGSNTQVQYNNSGSFGGITGATSNGTALMLTSPLVDTAVTWLFSGSNVGSQSVANPSAVTPTGSFINTWQGATIGGTTAIHLIPASGPLAGTVTTSEYVAGVTSSQAFGGNYGRWSYSNFASNLSGIVGEYGGTVTPALFNLQIGIENPPSTFTSYEFWRAQTTNGGAEDSQVGATLFGAIQPNPGTQQNRIVLIKPNIGTTGTRNSDAVFWEGKANNGSELGVWWRQYINVTSNAGTSSFVWQQNLNGAGYNTIASLSDAGIFTFAGLTLSSITGSTQCLQANSSGAVSGTGSACGSGSAGVASLGNASADTSLTIAGTGSGPWTGVVTAKLNLGNAQTWTGLQTYATGKLAINGGSATAGLATVTSAGVVSSEANATVAQGGTNCTSASGTCLDNITAFSSTGLINRTGAGTYSFIAPGTGVATALGTNVGSAGAFVVNGGVLGSPSSAGTLPAFTLGGTISGGGNQINNVIVGASTPLAGTFTSLNSQAGNSSTNVPSGGRLTSQLTPTGTPASTAATTLQTFSLPANGLGSVGQGVRVRAWGTFAANGDTKTVTLQFGAGNTLYSSTGLTSSGSNWIVWGEVYKTGSSAQTYFFTGIFQNTIPTSSTGAAAQTDTSAIAINIVGQNGTANANDIVCNGMVIEQIN